MSKKYNKLKINIDRPPVTEAEIKANMNFSGVLATAKRPEGIKGIKKLLLSATGGVMAVAIVAVILLGKSDGQSRYNSTYVPFSSYLVKAEAETTLVSQTGSIIHIPANVLVDKKGKAVTGEVTFRFREFHDAASIILSDIPMIYDSGGMQMHFESAGMFEILAEQEDEPLFIRKNASIDVKLSSADERQMFNLYYLDSTTNQWTVKGDDIAGIPAPADTFHSLASASIVRPVTAPGSLALPAKPKRANKNRPNFNIDADPATFPELQAYKNLKFEVAPEDTAFNPGLSAKTWNDVQVKRGKNGRYIITFRRGDEEHSFITYPVVEGTSYAEAEKIYKQQFREYEEKKRQREEQQLATEKQREKQLAMFRDQQEKELKEMQRRMLQSMRVEGTKDRIYRTFSVNQFGIWNSDSPCNLPKGQTVLAEYKVGGKPVEVNTAFVIEKGRNALFTYLKPEKLQFNPQAQNTIIAVTKDNDFLILRSNRVKQIQKPEEILEMESLGEITARQLQELINS